MSLSRLAMTLTLAVTLTLPLALSAGCEGKVAPTKTTSVVVLMDLSGSTLEEATRSQYEQDLRRITDRLYYGDLLSIWSVDADSISKSRPLSDDSPLPILVPTAKTDLKLEREREGFLEENPIAELREQLISPVLGRIKSDKTQGSDLFGALKVASRKFALASEQDDSTNTKDLWLVIFSDMLVSDGQLRMSKGFDPAKELERVKEAGDVAQLDGVNVMVIGAGGKDTAIYNQVQEFWLGYFEASGANMPPAHYGSQLPDELAGLINKGVNTETGDPTRQVAAE